MTQNNTQPLQTTLDHARKLAASGQATTITPSWAVQAHHVGDLSVLALALRS